MINVIVFSTLGFADAATNPIDFPIAPAFAVPKVSNHSFLQLVVFLLCVKLVLSFP